MNSVIWLFSCFKASPRCRAPSEPISLPPKLHFVLFLKSKTINVSYPFIYLSRKSDRLSYYLVMYVVVPKRRMRNIDKDMDGWIDKYDDPGKFNTPLFCCECRFKIHRFSLTQEFSRYFRKLTTWRQYIPWTRSRQFHSS